MPGNRGYKDWVWTVGGKSVPYGLFLADVVNFLIVAAALFLFAAKFLGWLTRARIQEAAAPPPPTKGEELLSEIRKDVLEHCDHAGGRTRPQLDDLLPVGSEDHGGWPAIVLVPA